MSAEAKVGLLVIVVALLAVGVVVYLKDYLAERGADEITVMFADVHGLRNGDDVRLGGHKIGDVKEVSINPDSNFPGKPVAVTCTISDQDAVLYRGDTFMIMQGALVGDKHLAILPGEREPPREKLEDGDKVAGGGASTAEVVMDEAQQLIVSARAAVDSVNVVLADVQMQQDFKATVGNLRVATEHAIVIADRAVAVVETFARAGSANEARLAAIMQNLIEASEDIAGTTQRVEDLVALTPLPTQVAAAGDNILRATEDLAAIAENARERIESSTMDQDVEATLANLRETSENLRELSADAAELAGDEQLTADIRAVTANVREASESLKAAAAHAEDLITDEQMSEDLRATVAGLRETAETSRATMDRADRVMTDIEGTMETVRRTQEIVTDIDTRARVQLLQAQDGGFSADAALDLRPEPDGRGYWRIGLRDVGDADGLDLQYAQQHGSDVLRAGLFGGDLGLGYDWTSSPGFGVESELYSPDDLRLDLRLRWSLQREYNLLLGLDRALDDNDPFLGVRYETDF